MMNIDYPEPKFKNKFRIPSARLPHWNYGSDGAYFITICTQNREEFFGHIVDGEMVSNGVGLFAHFIWEKMIIPFPNIVLDEFIIMPNHVHMIVIIINEYPVETRRSASLQTHDNKSSLSNKYGPLQKHSIPSIINHYKGAVTKHARKINPDFTWQTRYWDRVIRNDKELERIQKYIRNNPQKWECDRNNLS